MNYLDSLKQMAAAGFDVHLDYRRRLNNWVVIALDTKCKSSIGGKGDTPEAAIQDVFDSFNGRIIKK